MPEADSDRSDAGTEPARHGRARHRHVEEDITPILERRAVTSAATRPIRPVFPEFGPGWKLEDRAAERRSERPGTASSRWWSQSPDGRALEARLPADGVPADRGGDELQAAHAQDARVLPRRSAELRRRGTPNRLEYDQGFFVKHGDGAADVKPIAHLYKTQVYRSPSTSASPRKIRTRRRPPTPTRWRSPGGVLLLAAVRPRWTCACRARTTAARRRGGRRLGPHAEQVQRVYDDIDQKRRATPYLHLPPQLVSAVHEVQADAS